MEKEPIFSIVVIDNFNRHDPNDRFEVKGFNSREHALKYGLRRVRSSVEQFRKPDQNRDALHRKWMALGEEILLDGARLGLVNFDYFFENPATGEACDYLALAPVEPETG